MFVGHLTVIRSGPVFRRFLKDRLRWRRHLLWVSLCDVSYIDLTAELNHKSHQHDIRGSLLRRSAGVHPLTCHSSVWDRFSCSAGAAPALSSDNRPEEHMKTEVFYCEKHWDAGPVRIMNPPWETRSGTGRHWRHDCRVSEWRRSAESRKLSRLERPSDPERCSAATTPTPPEHTTTTPLWKMSI